MLFHVPRDCVLSRDVKASEEERKTGRFLFLVDLQELFVVVFLVEVLLQDRQPSS